MCKFEAVSAAEAELNTVFVNTIEAQFIRLILAELGRPLTPSQVYINNTTAVGIVKRTIKRQRPRSTANRYFGFLIQIAKGTLLYTLFQ